MSRGKPTNRLEADWDNDGNLVRVEFVPLTPEEYAAQREPTVSSAPEPLYLNLSEQDKKDPNLRRMAAEAAIYGVQGKPGHVWGE